MKKNYLLPLLLMCMSVFSAHATDTKLFDGDLTPSQFSYTDLINWSLTQIKTEGDYVNFGTDAAPAFTELADNPDNTGLNSSAKALHLTSLKGHSWWPDFMEFTLAAPITITSDNRYLHIMHYRQNLNNGYSVSINADTPLQDADKGTKRFDSNLSTAGKWEDIVIDLKWFLDNNVALSNICFLMDTNWGGAAQSVTNYYFDEVVLNNSSLPRGVNILPETSMNLFYGNTTSNNKWVKNIDTQNAENTYSVVSNPFTAQTATLNSASVLKFDKSANAAWWQGLRTVLPGVFQVGNGGKSNYLHVMVNIQSLLTGVDNYIIQLNAKDFAGKQIDSGDNLKYWTDDAGKWVDMVLDVTSLGYVQEFTVRFDLRRDASDNRISSPAGTFYMDAAAIDNNPDQRTVVTAPTAVKAVHSSNIKSYAINNTICLEGNNIIAAEVYNTVGSLVSSARPAMNLTQFNVTAKGVYMVKTTTTDGNVELQKVLVR